MKRSFFILALLSQLALGQGWQQLGPDSLNWMDAYYLSGRWLSPSTFHLAASTSQGVAIYSSTTSWNYALRHIPESIANQGISYALLEFSPWEPDSCFIGFYIQFVEADLHIKKCGFPPLGGPGAGGARGPCWMGPLSVAIPPNNANMVFAGVCGIQKSTNRGATWQNILSESPWGFSRLIAVDQTDPYIVYRAREGSGTNALFRSTNGGASWDSLFSPLPGTGYYGRNTNVVAHGDTILVGMRSYPTPTSGTGAIARSTNGGSTWSITYNQGRVTGLAGKPNSIYAAVTSGVIRSTDWGLTWTTFNNGLPTSNLTGLVVNQASDTVYISTIGYGVLKVWRFVNVAQNYYPLAVGNEWFYRSILLPPNDSTISSRVRVVGDSLFPSGRRYFVLSSNDIMESRFVRTDSNSVFHLNPYTGQDQRTFKFSGQIGDTTQLNWGPFTLSRLADIDTINIFGEQRRVLTFVLDGILYAVLRFSEKFGPMTEWRYSDPPPPWPDWGRDIVGCIIEGVHYGRTLDAEEQTVVPERYELLQNYPNPFNPSTTIKFTVPRKTNVTLKVFDLLGQEIQTLLRGEVDAGTRTAVWDAAGFAAGVYVCRLQTPQYTQSRKMLLLR